jgi:hypothetical protein
MEAMVGGQDRQNPECVWIVRGHQDPQQIRGWRPFEAYDNDDNAPDEILDAMKQSAAGKFLPKSRFPTDNYPMRKNYPPAHEERMPHLFSSGFIFVTEKRAQILRRFDIGQGALYPTRLWHPDRSTQVPGNYFYLSQGNTKNAFLREQSPEAYEIKRYRRDSLWALPPNPKNDQLFFSEAALGPPDIWWDVQIARYFLISDRLAQALDDGRVSYDWKLMRCPIARRR